MDSPEVGPEHFTERDAIMRASEAEFTVRVLDAARPEWRNTVLLERHEILEAWDERGLLTIHESVNELHLLVADRSSRKCFFRPRGATSAPRLTHTPHLPVEVGGGYRLLTHIYVHGIMHGEAWPEDETELEELVLV